MATMLTAAAQEPLLQATNRNVTSAGHLTVRRCGTGQPSESKAARLEADYEASQLSESLISNQRSSPAPKIIHVYFHVITDDDGKKGFVARKQLVQQVDALNKSYGGHYSGKSSKTGFKFVLKGFEYHKSRAWFRMTSGSSDDLAMKRKLRQQPEAGNNLNVYTVAGAEQLGWSTFPWDYSTKKSIDGIVISYRSVPGGKDTIADYSEGKTLAHETGHWLGMYHTFQGGCSLKLGDYVLDTVPELEPSYGCLKDRRSCDEPEIAKKFGRKYTDPTSNFMDYSFDVCTTTFTKGQAARMDLMWRRFRSVPRLSGLGKEQTQGQPTKRSTKRSTKPPSRPLAQPIKQSTKRPLKS